MAYYTITLRGPWQPIELPCGGNIWPGMLCKENSSGQAVVHATAGGFAEKIFALEDALQGLAPDTEYTTVGNMMPLGIFQSGALVNAMLYAGSNYTGGTQLISHGDGTLYPTTGSPSEIIAVVPYDYALNLSASGAVNTLNPVRIL